MPSISPENDDIAAQHTSLPAANRAMPADIGIIKAEALTFPALAHFSRRHDALDTSATIFPRDAQAGSAMRSTISLRRERCRAAN